MLASSLSASSRPSSVTLPNPSDHRRHHHCQTLSPSISTDCHDLAQSISTSCVVHLSTIWDSFWLASTGFVSAYFWYHSKSGRAHFARSSHQASLPLCPIAARRLGSHTLWRCTTCHHRYVHPRKSSTPCSFWARLSWTTRSLQSHNFSPSDTSKCGSMGT